MYLKNKDVVLNVRISRELEKELITGYNLYKNFCPCASYSDYIRNILIHYTQGGKKIEI